MKIDIDIVREIINDLYRDCQTFDSLSPTYRDRMRREHTKVAIIESLNRFCNSLDAKFLLIKKGQIKVLKPSSSTGDSNKGGKGE